MTKGEDTITMNLHELGGMVMTAYMTGDPVLLGGDNVAAVSWINRCGGSHDRRASLAMRLLGRLEITSGWSHDKKHFPGVQNVVENGISRYPKKEDAQNCRHSDKGKMERAECR